MSSFPIRSFRPCRWRRFLGVVASLVILGALPGCDRFGADTKPSSHVVEQRPPQDDPHEHDHDHDDAHDSEHENDAHDADRHDRHAEEHGIPRHKPADFALCVKAISGSGHDLLHHADDEQAAAHFRDFVRWLPELAADSDLRKQDWDDVVLVAKDFEAWFPQGGIPGSHRDFDLLADRLRKFVARAQSAGF